MNVGIRLDREDFLYDIHSLVKSFYPDDDVSVFVEGDTEKCAVPRDLLFEVSIPEYSDRKAAKDGLKRELYGTLCDMTGQTMPWGMLSGIRPTKIPMKLLSEGKSDDEILGHLRTYYLVSEKRADLALRIARTERELTAPLALGED